MKITTFNFQLIPFSLFPIYLKDYKFYLNIEDGNDCTITLQFLLIVLNYKLLPNYNLLFYKLPQFKPL